MPEPLIGMLIGISMTALIGYLYWAKRQQPDRRHGKVNEAERHCIWCLYRHRDVCIHPASPIYLGKCGPVCMGHLECGVRELKWRQG
jgi:hypothetical protein